MTSPSTRFFAHPKPINPTVLPTDTSPFPPPLSRSARPRGFGLWPPPLAVLRVMLGDIQSLVNPFLRAARGRQRAAARSRTGDQASAASRLLATATRTG